MVSNVHTIVIRFLMTNIHQLLTPSFTTQMRDYLHAIYQGSVLSPLLFILVLEALSREFRTGVPWELLYADDLVVIADSGGVHFQAAGLESWDGE